MAMSVHAKLGLIGSPSTALSHRGSIVRKNTVYVMQDEQKKPFPGALVRLHHLTTGVLHWQGFSDADGKYYPHNLIENNWYVPVAVDITGAHKCVAAGPVVAERADV